MIFDGDNFFDICANIGWYSINIAASRLATKVYCFEPIPKTYRHLEENIKLNSVRNIIAHNFGFFLIQLVSLRFTFTPKVQAMHPQLM